MRTDALIALLVADLRPVDSARVSQMPILASLIGAVAAFAVMFLVLGLHPGIFDAQNLRSLSIKVVFTLSTAVAAAALLPQFARPGAEGHGWFAFRSLRSRHLRPHRLQRPIGAVGAA